MQFSPPRRSNRLIINVTSLIDVMFLMLIFVLVTSSFKQQPAIRLDLPTSTTAKASDTGPSVLTLTEDGEVYFDRERVNADALAATLRKHLEESGDDRIVLRADSGSRHGDVVHLLDVIKESGYTRVSLSARAATADDAGGAP